MSNDRSRRTDLSELPIAVRPTGRFIGVGVGPGDPDLLTLRAINTVRSASHVVAPSLAAHAVGRAEAILRDAVPDLTIHRAVFSMDGNDEGPDIASQTKILSWLENTEDVAFVTLGDPNCYSTFWSVVDVLRRSAPEIAVETVPGIMAFQALAAASGNCLIDGAGRLNIVTALEGTGDLKIALQDEQASIVIYKGGRHVPDIAHELRKAGRLEDALFGELLGLPGERVGRLAAWSEQPSTYLATIIVPSRATHEPGAKQDTDLCQERDGQQ